MTTPEQRAKIAENCDEANIKAILDRLDREDSMPAKAFTMCERPGKYTPIHITEGSREELAKTILGIRSHFHENEKNSNND